MRAYAYQSDYQDFVQEAGLRQQKRKYLAERNSIWQERRDKNQAQIEAGEKQKENLLKEMNMIHEARETFNKANAVSVSEDADRETHRKWEAFFDMETNELPSSS